MTISIVTPSFNQGHFIERTLRSVLDQNVPGLDYVVVDGGSTDKTTEILRNFGEAIRWSSEPDRGQAHAVNKGILATQAPIIGWLNSDDIYYPGAISRVLTCFAEHPEVDLIYGMADHIDVDDHPLETYPTEFFNAARLCDTCYLCQPAVFFRRRVVEQFGLLDQRLNYCMDYEYWLRLMAGDCRFFYLQEKLAGSRMYAENKTLSSKVKVHREINDMQRRLLGRVHDAWLYNYAHAVVETRVKRASHPQRFVLEVGFLSLLAALWWNQRISVEMRQTTKDWLLRR
jgi:glycosyltransferase involved in cell wall biosynthesis